MSSDLSPQDIARIVEDNVRAYCANISGDSYLNCILEHSPEQLQDFLQISDYYGNDEKIGEILENGNMDFWKTLESEYEKNWMSDLANAIADGLGGEIQAVYESIIQDDSINDNEKVYLLKSLDNALDKLGKAITNALKSQTPLNTNELRKYIKDIVKSAGLLYTDNFEYFLDYYENSLSETGKLEVLDGLLDSIGNTMYDIDKKIKEYNSLQLTY